LRGPAEPRRRDPRAHQGVCPARPPSDEERLMAGSPVETGGAPTLAGVTAVVLAGGLGARLRGAAAHRPQGLAPVHGRPFLAFLLDQLSDAGVRRAVLATGHRGDLVAAEFGERYRELSLVYSHEDSPLGTGGALRAALQMARSPTVLALNGDS